MTHETVARHAPSPAERSNQERYAAHLRGLLAQRKIRAPQLARTLGWDRQKVYRRLNGSSVIPLHELEDIAAAVGVDPRDLIPPPRASEREAS